MCAASFKKMCYRTFIHVYDPNLTQIHVYSGPGLAARYGKATWIQNGRIT